MKVVGFSFVRNAIKFDYPIEEAIRSIMPLCDEIVVAVGQSEDDTRELVASIAPEKITVVDTVWDDSLREGGRTLAIETDKAYKALPPDADWAFYIQGDEVFHENGIKAVRTAMEQHKDQEDIDGLLFNYRHFYGSYDYVGQATRWYRREIRVVRVREEIYSYRDAQGFRKGENEKLSVKQVDAHIHHYGWVKDPRAQQRKQENFHKMWHSDEWMEKNVAQADAFDYSGVDALEKFKGTHPTVMQDRIERINWQFDYDLSKNKLSLKDRVKKGVQRATGVIPGEYKNYKIV